jgi:hypothetical protein
MANLDVLRKISSFLFEKAEKSLFQYGYHFKVALSDAECKPVATDQLAGSMDGFAALVIYAFREEQQRCAWLYLQQLCLGGGGVA